MKCGCSKKVRRFRPDCSLVGIVIPCHNRKKMTLACLEGLRGIETLGFEKRVYLVDDGSTDGTADAVFRQFREGVRIVRGDGGLYWTAAVNKGINVGMSEGCDYILTLNDDTTFEEDFLVELFDVAQRNENAIIGSITADRINRDTIVRCGVLGGREAFKCERTYELIARKARILSEPIAVDCVSGRSMLIPRKVFQDIGVFDEKMFPHSFADFEFCYRAKNFGYDVFIWPGSVIYTVIEPKFWQRLLGKNKFKVIYDLWFDRKYFGIASQYRLSRKVPTNTFQYFGYHLGRHIKWTLVRLILNNAYLKRFITKKGKLS